MEGSIENSDTNANEDNSKEDTTEEAVKDSVINNVAVLPKECDRLRNSETYQVFSWIETLVKSQFKSPENDFRLEEFELGNDNKSSEVDSACCSSGEGMAVPLCVTYILNQQKHSEHLTVYLPRYYVDTEDELSDGSPIKVPTHQTYFYSTVVPDLQRFLEKENVSFHLPLPKCCFVKHCEEYEEPPTPAHVNNLQNAKSLLVLADVASFGYHEIAKVEDVTDSVAEAVVRCMAQFHGLCFCYEQKEGRPLSEIWEDLPTMANQKGINQHIVESCFEYFEAELDDEISDDLVVMLLLERTKVEDVIKKAASVENQFANSVLHMMIGGPNLHIRERPEGIDCIITNWSLATLGNPVLDLALFTCVSLSPAMRKSHMDVFLETYWKEFQQTLVEFGVTCNIEFGRFCEEFKKQQLWSFLFMVAACKESDELRIEEIRDILESLLALVRDLPDV